MKSFKILISKDGSSVTNIYSDKIDMSDIGRLSIRRATEVKFSNEDQKWQVISLPPIFDSVKILATGFNARQDAIDWEINYLNANLEKLG